MRAELTRLTTGSHDDLLLSAWVIQGGRVTERRGLGLWAPLAEVDRTANLLARHGTGAVVIVAVEISPDIEAADSEDWTELDYVRREYRVACGGLNAWVLT